MTNLAVGTLSDEMSVYMPMDVNCQRYSDKNLCLDQSNKYYNSGCL